MKAAPKIIALEWTDHASECGWGSGAARPAIIHSIGFLIAEDKVGLTLSTSMDKDSGVSIDRLCILKNCVLKRKYVSGKAAPKIRKRRKKKRKA